MNRKTGMAVLCFFLVSGLGAFPLLAADQGAPAAPAQAAPAKPAPPPVKYDEVGAPLPPFTLKFLGSEKVLELSKLPKPSMFMFVNSSCSACRAEMGTFVSMAKKMKDKIDVYAVSVDFDAKSAMSRLTSPDMEGVYNLMDGGDFKVAGALGFNFTPATVIVSRDGKQLYRKGGFSEGDDKLISQEIMKAIK